MMSFFRHSTEILREEIDTFVQRYPHTIDRALVLVELALLSQGREALPEKIKDRQSSFISALAIRGTPSTDEIIRRIDKIRADPLWSRVLGGGSHAQAIIEQLQHPALTLFTDTAIFEVIGQQSFNLSFLTGGLRAAMGSHGVHLEPLDDMSSMLHDKSADTRMILLLKSKFMELSMIQLDEGQSMDEAIVSAQTKYLIVGHGSRLYFINRELDLRREIRAEDIRAFLLTKSPGQFLNSSFQEFENGYPPHHLTDKRDILGLLDEGDRESLMRLRAVEEEFSRAVGALIPPDLEVLERDYNRRLVEEGFTVSTDSFSDEFYRLFLDELSSEQLTKLLSLWNRFASLAFGESDHSHMMELLTQYQTNCYEILGPRMDVEGKLRMIQQEKHKFDHCFDVYAETVLANLQMLIAQREGQWMRRDFPAMRQLLTERIRAMEALRSGISSEVPHHDIELMKPSKKATKYYTQQIEELQRQLFSLSLSDLLGDKDYEDWMVLKQKLGQRPLRLSDKDMHALELLLFGQHSVSVRVGKLEHLKQVINFIDSYQTVRAYEKIIDKVMDRIDEINSTMSEWATTKKGEPGAKDEFIALNVQKMQLQQELSYLTTRTKKFIDLNSEQKREKLPKIMDCLSKDEQTVLIQLSTEIDALKVLSQYPQAHYLGASLPGLLGHHLDEMDKAFTEIKKIARPEWGAEEAHRFRPG